ncbi:MAG: hypothetical protein ACLTMP_13635 [Eggerthella lenta]
MADSVFPRRQPDQLEEECGVQAYAPGEDGAPTCYRLQALQHRSQSYRHCRERRPRSSRRRTWDFADPGSTRRRWQALARAWWPSGVRYSTSGGKPLGGASRISAIIDTLIALAHNSRW